MSSGLHPTSGALLPLHTSDCDVTATVAVSLTEPLFSSFAQS